jgi:hypothetical protein
LLTSIYDVAKPLTGQSLDPEMLSLPAGRFDGGSLLRLLSGKKLLKDH